MQFERGANDHPPQGIYVLLFWLLDVGEFSIPQTGKQRAASDDISERPLSDPFSPSFMNSTHCPFRSFLRLSRSYFLFLSGFRSRSGRHGSLGTKCPVLQPILCRHTKPRMFHMMNECRERAACCPARNIRVSGKFEPREGQQNRASFISGQFFCLAH